MACTVLPPTVRLVASTRQGPAALVKPDFTPTMPFEPTWVTILGTWPTTGSVTVGMATMAANVGSARPRAATFRLSAGVDTDPGS